MSSTAFRAPVAADAGAADSLTGPIAHGDETTVGRQWAVIAEGAPEVLVLFELLCGRTRVPPPGVEGGAG